MKVVALAKHFWRKFYDYVRYDFKEIVFPSALPDPPGTPVKRKLKWKDHIFVWKAATSIYLKSWKTSDIDLDEELDALLKPDKVKPKKEKKQDPPKKSTMEDIAVAAKAGSEHIRPALQRIYMTKASAYKDAVKSFVEGYQEGLTQVLNSDRTIGQTRSNSTEDAKKPDDDATKTKL